MMRRSTIKLLRFHFSLFLLPVFLFALAFVHLDAVNTLLVFLILHFLVYPASNGYNSYMDRDTTPIGGLENPPLPEKQLFYTTIVMDVGAILLSCLVTTWFVIGIITYILASRAYSYRGIRLKKYPLIGYLVVIIFQGALVFFLSFHGSDATHSINVPIIPMLASSLLIGGYYPLTQIYQHKEDLNDGVKTISYVLGKRGTFIFCAIVFGLASICMYFILKNVNREDVFIIYIVCMSPVVWFFGLWFSRVWHNEQLADYRNSFRMNILSSLCTTIFFIFLIWQLH